MAAPLLDDCEGPEPVDKTTARHPRNQLSRRIRRRSYGVPLKSEPFVSVAGRGVVLPKFQGSASGATLLTQRLAPRGGARKGWQADSTCRSGAVEDIY